MPTYNGRSIVAGDVQMQVARDLGTLTATPVSLGWRVKNFLQYRRRSVGQIAAAGFAGRLFGVTTILPTLSGAVYHGTYRLMPAEIAARLKGLLADNVDVHTLPAHFGGSVTDYGILSQRLVTDTGVGYIVDAFQNLVELETMKFHGFGTGTTAESAAQTALVTELTTQYVGDTRPTGTTTETSAPVYSTVATLSPDTGGTIAVTEHGIFSAASAGVMLDRSVFAAVNLVAGSDSLQASYSLTISSGG